MLSFREFVTGLRRLEIDPSCPVIVHASTVLTRELNGGTDSAIAALSSTFNSWLLPAFTYKTMITPELGPPGNAMSYGSGKDANRSAEIFRLDMPVDPGMGDLAEAVRLLPKARRSSHPILSLVGINASKILETQSIREPYAPIEAMEQAQGWVLLLGVDHRANTSIHYGEQLAGRKQFVRWALTSKGIIPCHKYPGCSEGFEAITPRLDEFTRLVDIGDVPIRAVPLVDLLDLVCALLAADPMALLCDRADCERCNAVRATVSMQKE